MATTRWLQRPPQHAEPAVDERRAHGILVVVAEGKGGRGNGASLGPKGGLRSTRENNDVLVQTSQSTAVVIVCKSLHEAGVLYSRGRS